MDDEFSEFFLLNDCLISGRLSPGPPDDFLSHGTIHDTILSGGGHNHGEGSSNYLTFGCDGDFNYSSALTNRSSTIGSSSTNFMKQDAQNIGDDGVFAYVKSEELESPLSSSGQSPDHDYINEANLENDVEVIVANGNENRNDGGICSGTMAASAEYSLGTVGDGDSSIAEYDVTNYYCSPIKATPICVGEGSRILITNPHVGHGNPVIAGILLNGVASDIPAASPNTTRLQVLANSRGVKSEVHDEDVWSSGSILPREDDVAPSADDNSSTTSGDSCSNCDYMGSASPAPSQTGHSAYSVPHQTSGITRYRPIQPSNAAAMNMNLRTRSKMHELALKHKLISDQDPRSRGYVFLSAEERRTLVQEGLPVPTKLPLSKQEEEALKIVRRKIKNKLSAQESRRKRKEYMETLEQQIEGYQTENSSLRRRIDTLEKTNQSLTNQLKKLQQQFSPGSTLTSATSFVDNGHSSGDQSAKRGAAHVHHTVSLAAIFILFAVMIPVMPMWPSAFQNAFISTLVLSKANEVELTKFYIDVSNENAAIPSTRVLSSSNYGDCDIPYSADYFEKLNECHQDDLQRDDASIKGTSDGFIRLQTVTYAASDDSNFTKQPVVDYKGNSVIIDTNQIAAVAVCETVACYA